ncbi:MAG: hypothetical protein KA524_08725 [Nitrosomonas sp.]|nr:hypothetical protein [Nitrosomonas sp.]MBP6076366.1 hypothetical protein [Nitrosomonas sp.]
MSVKSESPSHKFRFAALVGIMLTFIAFGVLYRTSSQGDLSDTYPKGFRGGACTIETEALIVGYSGYYLPDDYEVPGDTIRSPYMPVQCGKIPRLGMLNISIDLLYPESARDIPLALRLVKIEIDEKENQQEFEVLSVPAQRHQSGVITQTIKLSELGQYYLYLDGENADTSFQVKIPLAVGLNWRDQFKKLFSTFLKNH